ncbi:hypothetical protein JCM6882_000144 [Rhodosporidiobolus microsporus]
MSARTKHPRKATASRANPDEDDELASDEHEDEPMRKKRRTRRKGKARGKKEKKDVLQTMEKTMRWTCCSR